MNRDPFSKHDVTARRTAEVEADEVQASADDSRVVDQPGVGKVAGGRTKFGRRGDSYGATRRMPFIDSAWPGKLQMKS